MCSRFTNTASPKAIGKQFNVPEPSLFEPRYNIAPTQTIAAVREKPRRRQGTGQLALGTYPLLVARRQGLHQRPR
jgi:putative SOS response-associated peptidase YedK